MNERRGRGRGRSVGKKCRHATYEHGSSISCLASAAAQHTILGGWQICGSLSRFIRIAIMCFTTPPRGIPFIVGWRCRSEMVAGGEGVDWLAIIIIHFILWPQPTKEGWKKSRVDDEHCKHLWNINWTKRTITRSPPSFCGWYASFMASTCLSIILHSVPSVQSRRWIRDLWSFVYESGGDGRCDPKRNPNKVIFRTPTTTWLNDRPPRGLGIVRGYAGAIIMVTLYVFVDVNEASPLTFQLLFNNNSNCHLSSASHTRLSLASLTAYCQVWMGFRQWRHWWWRCN